MIALADCNNFYASCERSIRPELEGKPIVVLSNNDGCIIARSNESKALGYKMGAPYFKVRARLLRDQVHVFSGNVPFYREVSEKIMKLLESECNAMEIYSIDEAFLDFTDVAAPDEKAILLKKRVFEETKIPISIGIAQTKVLAKLASHIAKKHTHTGVFLLHGKDLVARALSHYAVEELWGVGRKHAHFLHDKGIFQASQLAKTDESWLRRHMKIGGVRLARELNGIPCFALEECRPSKKSIMTSRSFRRELMSFEALNEALSNFASSCAFKLRKQNTRAKKIAVFIQTNRFKSDVKRHSAYLELEFPLPTNDSIAMVKGVYQLLDRMYDHDCQYKRAGVIVSDIIPDHEVQLNLFSEQDFVKRAKLMKVYDAINHKMGEGTLRLSIQGTDRKWARKNEPIAFRN